MDEKYIVLTNCQVEGAIKYQDDVFQFAVDEFDSLEAAERFACFLRGELQADNPAIRIAIYDYKLQQMIEIR